MGKKVIIKNPIQIKNIIESGKYLTELLILLKNLTKPGVKLLELEAFAQSYLNKNGLKGAFHGYHDFPANLCLSVNDCIVHGIPDRYILKAGDLLKIDMGIDYRGGVSDSAISVVVGGNKHNPQGAELIKFTKLALDDSIKYLVVGRSSYDYANNVYNTMKSGNMSVIKTLTGHGVGALVHEAPYIYNYPAPETKTVFIKENMTLALEPITAITSDDFVERQGGNGRNLYTKNGDLGAQREYTVLITSNGPQVIAGVQ